MRADYCEEMGGTLCKEELYRRHTVQDKPFKELAPELFAVVVFNNNVEVVPVVQKCLSRTVGA